MSKSVSGKTVKDFSCLTHFTYCLTLLSRPREKRGGPNVLVLSPTRELAQQIEVEVKKINYRGIRRYVIILHVQFVFILSHLADIAATGEYAGFNLTWLPYYEDVTSL